jgi:hypothetical protein
MTRSSPDYDARDFEEMPGMRVPRLTATNVLAAVGDRRHQEE